MKILICITFHYNQDRIKYLKKVIKGFINFANQVNIYVITNTSNKQDLDKLISIFPPQNYLFKVAIKSFEVKSHPHNLILCHKEFFLNEFINSDQFTHFLHTEDDLLFNEYNFKYWLKYRRLMDKYKIIPSFFRVERIHDKDFFKSTDVGFKIFWFFAPKRKIMNLVFVNMPNPSQSNYLVDKKLGREMLESPPNIRKHYYLNSNIGIRETTDIGPIFSNVPKFYISRNFVPITISSKKILEDCLIEHLPANYANNKYTKLGKVNINEMIYYFPFPDSTLLRNIKYYIYVYFRNLINYAMLFFIK